MKTCLWAALLICSCSSPKIEGGSDKSFVSTGAYIGEMGACPGTSSVDQQPKDVRGLVKVVLPDDLTLSQISRRASIDANYAGDLQNIDEHNDPTTNGNIGTYANSQPLDAHINGPYEARFIAVMLIKKRGSPYLFFDAEQIQGIALGSANAGSALCGAHFTEGRTGAARRRQAVTFFVDTSKFTSPMAVPFTIGVVPDSYSETTIFIDPKVRNDGRG